MKNNAIDVVEKEVENLYQTFAHYRLGKHVHGCSCCVFEEDQKLIRSKPLNELSAADLSKYAHKALTTWGSSNDFRHFLPRLFEIIIHEPVALTDPEILFGKLSYANWGDWPVREKEAIKAYFLALWKYQLGEVEPEDYTNIGSFLCGIALAVENIQPYLSVWESSLREQTSRNHLEMFIAQHEKELSKGRLKFSFWSGCSENATLIVDWITRQGYLDII